jgi:DNA segregation ATPase FtsK/SpoIIIE, S-DNA-T family
MISRLINKTPLANEKCNVYELDDINSDLLTNIIQSRFAGEGVFGIEQYTVGDYREQYLFSPSFQKYPLPSCDKEWQFDLKEVTVYELVLEKPMFMPLDTKHFIDLLNMESEAMVFTQLLLSKRLDNWRELAISQYETFLKGNDNPLTSKLSIKFQEKVLNVLTKIGNYTVKREPIDEIEQKILQHNYRFECRFVLYDDKNEQKFVSKVEKNLQKLQLFNEFRLKKVQNKRSFIKLIENREFQVDLVNQMLSESEIYSLLCSHKVESVQKVELEKPVKTQSTIRNLEDSMLLQRAVELMPKGESRNVEIDQSKAELINQAFKRVGIVKKPLKVTEMYQGSSLLKVQMQMSADITYTSISKKLIDIQAALGNQNVSIEIGDKPDTVNIFTPLEERGTVYFRGILESDEFQTWCKNNPLPFIIGENVNGELMYGDLAELRHLLIAGATGSGKSVFVNLLLLSLIINVPPEELSLYLVDPKQVEYTFFDGFPQVKQIITDMKKADRLLESLVNEMEKRYDLFAKSGVKNITSYNKNNDNKIPYIVTAIDEYADLVMENPKVEHHLVRLGQKARAAGIHLIICTQKPLADIVTSVLKSNLPSAISFRLKTSQDYLTVFGKGIPYNLLGRGDGVSKLEGQLKEYERFQSPILTLVEEEEEEIYTQLKELFKDIVVEDDQLPEAESEIDKLKRIIANTNELRVSELGRLMEIGNNKVHGLIQELLQQEWLRKEGRSYMVNVDEDEINKWRESS